MPGYDYVGQQPLRVVCSANLSTEHRTVSASLLLFHHLKIKPQRCIELLEYAGLSANAYSDPHFPVSLEQDYRLYHLILEEVGHSVAPAELVFLTAKRIGIDTAGIAGLAACHAANVEEVIRIGLNYPELTWGHSRVLASLYTDHFIVAFEIERPVLSGVDAAHIERLVEFCMLLDSVAFYRQTQDIFGDDVLPERMDFSFSEPPRWPDIAHTVPFPVVFDALQNAIYYPASTIELTPLKANPIVCLHYEMLAKNLSKMMVEDVSVTERVAKWLWAYTPPLGREEIARQLCMSNRTLARKLKAEGSSYTQLYNHVQAERAKNLLRNPALSATDIAYRLGYSDPAAFSRAFSAQVGVPPAAWRRQ